jgi:site-specific DNA-methyltransferase (adenine-specific)
MALLNNMRAKNNRTIQLTETEINLYKNRLLKLEKKANLNAITNKTINQNLFEAVELLPSAFVDLLFIDPPYNLDRKFNTVKFKSVNNQDYEDWVDGWLGKLVRLLKPNASVYICCDWNSSSSIYNAAKKYFKIQNRITWEREKGRGAKANWKNCTEDIWFCTLSDKYVFNINDVKLKRKVLAPYTLENGKPKDWQSETEGNFRITSPSNIWTDISVPFWSMPENTDHPTQKPEKLLAKIILASSNKGDFVLDPFAGSGTTQVTAKKLGRKYLGIELDEAYCCLTEKRLASAEIDGSIQGYSDGVFWERNTLQTRKKLMDKKKDIANK